MARVTEVRLEWAPDPKEEYLDDRTAFDAFIEYEMEGGEKGGSDQGPSGSPMTSTTVKEGTRSG